VVKLTKIVIVFQLKIVIMNIRIRIFVVSKKKNITNDLGEFYQFYKKKNKQA